MASAVNEFDSEGYWLGWRDVTNDDYEDWSKKAKDEYGIDIPAKLIAEYDKYVDPNNGPGYQGMVQILSPMVQGASSLGLTTDDLIKGMASSGWSFGSEGVGFTDGSNYSVGLDALNNAARIAGKSINLNTPEIQQYKAQQQNAMNQRIDYSRNQSDSDFFDLALGMIADVGPVVLPFLGPLALGAMGIGAGAAGAAGGTAVGEVGGAAAGAAGGTAVGEVGGAALGEAASAGIGELGSAALSSSLDPLLSSSFLADGALSASELAGILGSEGWAAADIAALTQGAANTAGGGMWDWLTDSVSDIGDWFGDLFSSADTYENVGGLFDTPTTDIWQQLGIDPPAGLYGQSTIDSSLLEQLGITGDYGGMSFAPWADALTSGASPSQLTSWLTSMPESSLLDLLNNPLREIENKLGLPEGTINTANKARSILETLSGGSESGVRSLLKSAGLSDGVADLLGTGLGLFGGYLQGNAASDAARQQAQATIEAARIAADASKFRPVGVTTRFGQSQFGYDANGNLVSAGYGLTPDIKAQQDKLLANSGGLLDQYLGAQSATAPLGTAAQRMFELGGGYLAANPQDQAAKFLSEQQALLAPSNERQLADLMNTLQQQGRMGLATGGTSTMAAANPALEAYYNAINQQNRQLAADATKGGMDYAKFGAGMFGLGGDTLKQMYGTQSEAFKPYSTSLGGATTIEGLGQNAMDIGTSLGSSANAANAQGGRLLQQGMTDAARIQAPANAYSPWAGLLTGAGQSIQGYKFDPLTGRAL